MATTFRTKEQVAFPRNPGNTIGKKNRIVPASFTTTSGTSAAGDIYILGGPYTLDDKINGLLGSLPAFTSATSNDLGFYRQLPDLTFAAITIPTGDSRTVLWSAVDLSSATAFTELLFAKNPSLDFTKNIRDLLGLGSDQAPSRGVFLGLRMNNANTAASVSWRPLVVSEEATTK